MKKLTEKKKLILLKSTLKKVFKLGVCDVQTHLIETTFMKIGQCLHSGWDANYKCVRCGKKLHAAS